MIAVLSAPPAPFVPEQYHFATGYALAIAGFGSAEEHAKLVGPVHDALAPAWVLVTPIPYTGLQSMLDEARDDCYRNWPTHDGCVVSAARGARADALPACCAFVWPASPAAIPGR